MNPIKKHRSACASVRAAHMILIGICFSAPIFGWNAVGHKLVAQIAYQRLKPTVKKRVDFLTSRLFHSHYADGRFLQAATWPDRLKLKTKRYNQWHYINLPDAKKGMQIPPVNQENVVWAIHRAERILRDSNVSPYRRAKYLSFLVHFVGDIAQPLHCVTRYTRRLPNGDEGGNLFPIQSPIANNLHQYWDKGLGLFYSKPGHYRFYYHDIVRTAKAWSQEYPVSYFGERLMKESPKHWAQESQRLAVKYAYDLAPYAKPSHRYNIEGKRVVRQQVVLGGYRLANLLNRIFGQ